jgi:sugar phosphate permease
MGEDTRSPQINVSKLAVGGGIVGLIFALGSMAIFFIGIPLLRYMFPAAAVLGCAIALVLRLMRHKTPGAPWLRAATENETESYGQMEHKEPKRSRERSSLALPPYRTA